MSIYSRFHTLLVVREDEIQSICVCTELQVSRIPHLISSRGG